MAELKQRASFKQFVKAPILRTFWRKDKEGEIQGTYADFTHKTSHTPLKTSKDCFIFSWAVSEYIMLPLKQMLDNAIQTGDKPQAKKIMGTINWLRKKAFKHSAEVRNEMKAMSEHPEFLKSADEVILLDILDETSIIMENMSQNTDILRAGKNLGIHGAHVKEIMLKIAALHDIGRLAEIDLQIGAKYNGADRIAHEMNGERTAVNGVDHAITSYEVAKANGVEDPLILLPIKYHSVRDLETEIKKDAEFLALDETKRAQVLLFGHAIRDADKIANLISYTKTGVKLCGEMNNPSFHGDCDISPAVLEDFYNNKTVNVKVTKTYLDAMFKFASWTYDLHFDFNKERAAKTILDPLFERMREENRDELSNKIKSERQDWRTYEKLTSLQKNNNLTPEQLETLGTLKETYKVSVERVDYLNSLRSKALQTLNVINEAHAHICAYMNTREADYLDKNPQNNSKNDRPLEMTWQRQKVFVPRTSNTSALFQQKKRQGR